MKLEGRANLSQVPSKAIYEPKPEVISNVKSNIVQTWMSLLQLLYWRF